jgi:hypothetical protein
MKRILSFLAMTAMILAVSCNKDDNGGKDKKDKGGKDSYEQPIKIDGNFDDWAKLDATKIATAKCEADATKTALKLVKVYADAVFVFVYFEWDKDQISFEKDVEHVPFHIYINGDGNSATGGFGDQWSDACSDTCFEGFLTDGSSIVSYDPGVYSWQGEVNGSGWEWSDPAILDAGSGICAGAGVEGKYELLITRELYPVGKLADNFSIGFDIQQGWNSVGILPNAAPTDNNPAGTAPSLQVVTVK